MAEKLLSLFFIIFATATCQCSQEAFEESDLLRPYFLSTEPINTTDIKRYLKDHVYENGRHTLEPTLRKAHLKKAEQAAIAFENKKFEKSGPQAIDHFKKTGSCNKADLRGQDLQAAYLHIKDECEELYTQTHDIDIAYAKCRNQKLIGSWINSSLPKDADIDYSDALLDTITINFDEHLDSDEDDFDGSDYFKSTTFRNVSTVRRKFPSSVLSIVENCNAAKSEELLYRKIMHFSYDDIYNLFHRTKKGGFETLNLNSQAWHLLDPHCRFLNSIAYLEYNLEEVRQEILKVDFVQKSLRNVGIKPLKTSQQQEIEYILRTRSEEARKKLLNKTKAVAKKNRAILADMQKTPWKYAIITPSALCRSFPKQPLAFYS